MRISMTAIAATAIFALLAGAHANGSERGSGAATRGRSVVQYGDLDIATEPGAKIMLLRIERAAAKACGGQPTFSTYTGALDNTFEECRRKAVERAVRQLGAPMVIRLYSDAKPRES